MVLMKLSVVIAAHNEAENLPVLLQEIAVALSDFGSWEVVVVDDGSTDATQTVLAELRQTMLPLRVVRHRFSCGQSQAVMTGVDVARGTVIATLDGDGQNDPADLRAMYELLTEDAGCGLWMVAGHRRNRRDSAWRVFSSRVANAVRSRILGDNTPDTGCGIKVFYRSVFLQLPRFNHMHRFLPALVVRGGGRVISAAVNHRPRLHGRSHYDTLRRLLSGLIDLVGVAWLIRRSSVPVLEQPEGAENEREVLDHLRFGRPNGVHGAIRRSLA
jgi:dolichol-phosphate mannosyltransferase